MPAERPPRPHAPRRGLSLVELLIGLVIGLLISLAAISSLRVFSAGQRQGVAAGSSLLSASGALGMVKNDVASAGLGFFDGSAPLCSSLNLSLGNSVVVDGTAFAPLQVSRSDGQDRLDLVYANEVAGGITLPLTAPSSGGNSQTLSPLPAAVGQAVLLSPQATGRCTVRTVTAVTAATEDTPQVLGFAAAGLHNGAAFTYTPNYAVTDRVSLIGDLVWHRYRIINGNLVLEQPLAGSSAVLVRQVVALRVAYGVSDVGSQTLNAWREASEEGWDTLNANNIGRVRAVRLGLLVRSPQREKPDADGVCRTTLSKPTLFGQAMEPDVSDWACYRFRSTTVVVPLRNLVWGQQT